MALVRSIGRWAMTALVINGIIGAGIFALPGEINRLLGRASPFSVIVAAVAMAVIMACAVGVASPFSEPGRAYLYTRTAFGCFIWMRIGWFFLLAAVSAISLCANLFVDYLAPFLSWTPNTCKAAGARARHPSSRKLPRPIPRNPARQHTQNYERAMPKR